MTKVTMLLNQNINIFETNTDIQKFGQQYFQFDY